MYSQGFPGSFAIAASVGTLRLSEWLDKWGDWGDPPKLLAQAPPQCLSICCSCSCKKKCLFGGTFLTDIISLKNSGKLT